MLITDADIYAMARIPAWLAAPRTQVIFNGVFMAMWFVMVPVTLIVPALRNAILYVALMSVWANFATHLGGWISALVNVRAARIDDRSEEIATVKHVDQVMAHLASVLDNQEAISGLQEDTLKQILAAIQPKV